MENKKFSTEKRINLKKCFFLAAAVISYVPLMMTKIASYYTWIAEKEFYGSFFLNIFYIFLIIAFSVKASQACGKYTGWLILLGMCVTFTFVFPIRNVAIYKYLEDNIDMYNEAVDYILEIDNGENMRAIETPDKFESTALGYIRFMRDENTIKIFFDKDGFEVYMGYTYVINLEDAPSPYIKKWSFFELDFESEQGGFWVWETYPEWGVLP